MVKVFFLFDEFSESANLISKNCAEKLSKLDCECSFSSRPLDKNAIIAADYLFIVLSDKCDPYNTFINDGYRYFLDEITWKRKESGEVIVLAPESFEEKELPYRLREKKVFSNKDFSKLEEYLTLEEEPIEKKKMAIEAPKQIHVTAKIAPIVQPVYSPKKIETPGFVNKKIETADEPKEKKRNTGACQDDHIFPGYGDNHSSGIYDKKSYGETKRVDNSTYANNKKTVNTTYKKDYKESNKSVNNKSGCLIFFIIGFFFVAFVSILFGVIYLATSGFTNSISSTVGAPFIIESFSCGIRAAAQNFSAIIPAAFI